MGCVFLSCHRASLPSPSCRNRLRFPQIHRHAVQHTRDTERHCYLQYRQCRPGLNTSIAKQCNACVKRKPRWTAQSSEVPDLAALALTLNRQAVQEIRDPERHRYHRHRQHCPGHDASIAKQCSECLDGLHFSHLSPGTAATTFLQNRLRSPQINRREVATLQRSIPPGCSAT